MDTGATFTMLPRQFDFAWTDLKPCLYTVEGCFKGSGTNDETEIGEFVHDRSDHNTPNRSDHGHRSNVYYVTPTIRFCLD